jgi:hypothetical protein
MLLSSNTPSLVKVRAHETAKLLLLLHYTIRDSFVNTFLIPMSDIFCAQRYFHVFGEEEWGNCLNSKPPI